MSMIYQSTDYLTSVHGRDDRIADFFKRPLSAVVLMFVTNGFALSSAARAAEVYRCEDAGRVTYTSNPAFSPSCKPVDLKVSEPNPADVSRAIQEKQRKAMEEEAAEEQARQERLVRAREIEAEAALRRARAAEEEARALQRREQETGSQVIYPGWGYPILRPPLRSHPHVRRHHQPNHRPGVEPKIPQKYPLQPAPKPQPPFPGRPPHPRSR